MGSWAQVAGAWEMHLFQAIRGWKMWNWRLFSFFSIGNLVPSHFSPCYVFVRLCEILFEYSLWKMCKERWDYTPTFGCSIESHWKCRQPRKGSLCEVTGCSKSQGSSRALLALLHTARDNQLMWHCCLNSVKVGAASLAVLNRVAPRKKQRL